MGSRARNRARGGQAPQPAVPPTSTLPKRPAAPVRFAHRGERPRGLFGPLPVSEGLIVLGLVLVAVGLSRGQSDGQDPMLGGLGLAAVGVVELTLREHLAGYRSHALLLAFLPVVALQLAASVVGLPSWARVLVLAVDLVVFLLVFRLLRATFLRARQQREPRSRTGGGS